MKTILSAAAIGAVLAGWVAGASAQQAQPYVHDLGKLEYESSCASCHGLSGKGDGSLRNYLTKPPSDLTTLAKRNGGAFPTQLVWEMIDGRSSTDVFWHGSREMPVWGLRYRVDAMKDPATMGQPEWYVRGRIVALLDYLARIQQK